MESASVFCKNFLAIFFDKTTIITMQTQLKRREGV